MPEGHTIHRIARDHRKWFVDQVVGMSSPQGRFELEAKKLDGQRLSDVTAHGKHLFYHFTARKIVHVHLGLYGKFRIHRNPAPEPRGAVRIRLIGSERCFDLNGPNCCELIGTSKYQAIRSRLGVDPLDQDADPEWLWNRIQKSRSSIGSLLLNQSVIAGVGNVYRAEILYLLGIHPETKSSDLSRDQFDQLWQLTVKLLSTGVKYNKIITVAAEEFDKPMSRLTARERVNVYKKSSCRKCGSQVKNWMLANRKMFACPSCQVCV